MSLVERLQLVVEATTNGAEAKWAKLTGTVRETGETAGKSALSVSAAADRVAAAREREATAAANLRVAETRLQELRDSGRAKASQLVAAEEKVAAAQRGVQSSAHATAQATDDQRRAQVEAATSMDDTAESGGGLREQMDGVKGSIVALGGAGLVELLRGFGEGFASAARDAGLLATSMNASVGEASAFLGLVGTLGLDMNDLLEIQAEFAAGTKDGLTQLGTELQHNADGTVNWTNTLVDTLAALQKIPDATERNRQGFAMFGEEGYKQLSQLVASGTDVRDALAKIGTPFTEADVQAASDYDTAMTTLSLSSQHAQQSLGRVLLPVITAVVEGIGDLSGVVSDIPVGMGLATAAALGLGMFGLNPAAVAGTRLTAVKVALTRQLLLYSTAAGTGTRASFLLAGGMGAVSAASRGLMGIVGGPLGVAMIGLGALYTAASGGVDDFRESAKKAATELAKNEDASKDAADTAQEMGRRLAEEAGFWERLAAARASALQDTMQDETPLGDPLGITALGGAFGTSEAAAQGFTEEIDRQREALGGLGVQQEATQQATRSLTDLIVDGDTSSRGFSDAVRDAAEAQAQQTQTSDTAEAAIAAYNATTRDAVQSTLALFEAQLGQRDGLIGLQQDIYAAKGVVDDLKTPWNEVDEATNKVISSTLDYASTAADAAVAAATANGTVLTGLAEAQIRAQATVKGLRESLRQKDLSKPARDQIQGLIKDLEAAQKSGDIKALLTLTGAKETGSELDKTTKDRDTHVRVETRNGPAVDAYLDRLTKQRLIILRAESRNGPAVDTYLDRVAHQRLSIIRVETRNGPAVDDYLDRLASQSRVAYIDVRQRGGATAVPGSPTGLRGAPATAGAFGGGSVTIQSMAVTVQADSSGRVTPQSAAEGGRQVVAQLGAYTRQNGSGWLRGLQR